MGQVMVTARQLAGALRAEERGIRRAVDKGVHRAALRGKDTLRAAADQKGIKYRGRYKASFVVDRMSNGTLVLHNFSPLAGVMEIGARPHTVSEGGIRAIMEWAKRTIGAGGKVKQQRKHGPLTPLASQRLKAALDEREGMARAVAESIAREIQAHGQQGRFVFRDALGVLTRQVVEEVNRALEEHSQRPARGRAR